MFQKINEGLFANDFQNKKWRTVLSNNLSDANFFFQPISSENK